MKNRKKYDTAARVLFVRAWEHHQQPEARVCSDPLAERMLSPIYKFFAINRLGRKFFWKRLTPFQKSLFGYIPLRTRLIDDYLDASLRDGLEQLVILGAGYDSRAYRFDELKNCKRVFEVDLEENLTRKMFRIEKVLGALPQRVTYVPIDFEKDALFDILSAQGYDEDLSTLFIWEGVTYYLEAGTVRRTLASVVDRSMPGSSIIFDYAPSEVVNGMSQQPLAKDMIEAGEQLGEPIRFGIRPDSIGDFLTQVGFTKVENHSVEECKRKYHKAVHKDREVLGFFNIVHATVA